MHNPLLVLTRNNGVLKGMARILNPWQMFRPHSGSQCVKPTVKLSEVWAILDALLV